MMVLSEALGFYIVATVLTVYGIETCRNFCRFCFFCFRLQQYLPFTVLKLDMRMYIIIQDYVATVLTVYGIETNSVMTLSHSIKLQQYLPFTVLKPVLYDPPYRRLSSVATVLTVYGIETTPKLLSLSIL